MSKGSSTERSIPVAMVGEIREVGSVKEINLDTFRVLYHFSGNPAEEALMLKELLDRGLKQSDIAKLLEVNQGQISRKLKLLQLTPTLFDRVLQGEIKARTGYQLARLPKDRQKAFEAEEKVTMKDSERAVREYVLNEDVVRLVRADDPPKRSRVRELVDMVYQAANLAGQMDVKLGNGVLVGALLGGIYEDIKNLELEEPVCRFCDHSMDLSPAGRKWVCKNLGCSSNTKES